MTIYRFNNTRIRSKTLTDSTGVAITTGTVEHAITSIDKTVEHVAPTAMAHIGSPDGRWEIVIASEDGPNLIPAREYYVKSIIRVGGVGTIAAPTTAPDAQFERVEPVLDRVEQKGDT